MLQPLIDSQNPEDLSIRDEIRAIQSITGVEVDGIGSRESSFGIDQTLRFRIDDGPTRQTLRLGYTTFNQQNFSPLGNTTLQVGGEGQVNTLRLAGTAGVDLFSRLPTAPPWVSGSAPLCHRTSPLQVICGTEPIKKTWPP